MKSLGSQIRAARQRRHLSQSALARQVGCRQSALSMYEGGRDSALSAQTVGKLCEALGLLPPAEGELRPGAETGPQEAERVFCPNAACPSNLPVGVGGRTVLAPRAHLAGAEEVHCAWCGEVLERACPECGAPVDDGHMAAHLGEEQGILQSGAAAAALALVAVENRLHAHAMLQFRRAESVLLDVEGREGLFDINRLHNVRKMHGCLFQRRV